MTMFILAVSLIANVFNLLVLRNIVTYYSQRVAALEQEVHWVSLEVRALQ